MRTIRTLELALLLLLFVTGPIQAKPDFSELEKLVPEELKERNTPGAVIAIVSAIAWSIKRRSDWQTSRRAV